MELRTARMITPRNPYDFVVPCNYLGVHAYAYATCNKDNPPLVIGHLEKVEFVQTLSSLIVRKSYWYSVGWIVGERRKQRHPISKGSNFSCSSLLISCDLDLVTIENRKSRATQK